MVDNKKSEFIKQKEYIENLKKFTIITSKDDFDIICSNYIIIDNIKVPIEVIKRILNQSYYFDYTEKYLSDEIGQFKISCIDDNNRICGSIKLYKMTIIKAIEELLATSQIKPDVKQILKYFQLKGYLSYENFVKKYNSQTYNIIIENKNYSIPISNIISFMSMSDDKLDELIKIENEYNIFILPLKYLAYASLNFFEDNSILENYFMPEIILKRYKELKNYEKIDFQSINKIKKKTNNNLNNIIINTELRKEIFKNMPSDLTILEQAIYIYIKMCKLLSYDFLYYITDQKGEIAKMHEDINNVENINLYSNKVVCFEFSTIYAKLLNELNIDVSLNYYNLNDEYGHGHSNIIFRINEFLIQADSVTSILYGDLSRVKLGHKIIGLKSINKNKKTHNEFIKSLDKVYKIINEQYKDKQISIEEYLDKDISSNDIKELNLIERTDLFIKVLTYLTETKKIYIMDILSCIIPLKKMLFSREELDHDISINIIKRNNYNNYSSFVDPVIIITLNNCNLDKDKYIIYVPKEQCYVLNNDELQELFRKKIFEYININSPCIPEIVLDNNIQKKKKL